MSWLKTLRPLEFLESVESTNCLCFARCVECITFAEFRELIRAYLSLSDAVFPVFLCTCDNNGNSRAQPSSYQK